ncbi:MAG: HYR domain-containing protein [Chitinophagaceae bacterium]|nr:HYR domain-containing protein [Chitinophagaceae bacterium]
MLVIETVPPNIYCPLDKNVTTDVGKCYRTGPVSLGTPVVNDNCGIASVTNNAPAVYQKGENLVTWTVTDKSGNTRTCVQRVTVTDAERPTITCPVSLIVNADPGPGCGKAQLSLPLPVFNDNCGVVTLTWAMVGVTYGSSGNTGINYVPTMNYLVGISTITYTAIDEAGNSRTCTFRVTVKDVTAPLLVCPPAETFCKVANNTYSIPALVQSDNCVIVSTTFKITGATSRTGSGTNASGIFNLGVSTILWTVKDSHGNISTCTTVITVVATSNPICTPPPFTVKGNNPKFTETVVPGLSITAWPNPSVNYFNLKVTSQSKENVLIKMYDMAGKLVQVKRGAAGDNYILGEGVVSGMYFIEVSQGDKTARTKVVKQ